MASLGVYYNCYNEGVAVDKSIETHFEHIPDCKIFLVSEGDDFSHLEKMHSNIKTTVKSDIASWGHKNVPHVDIDFRTPEIQLGLEKFFDEFFSRTKEAIEYCQTDYLLTSQPDVILRGRLTIPENVSLLQPFVNHYSTLENDNDIVKALKEIPGSCDFTYWGYPQILSTQHILRVIEVAYESDKKVLRKLMASDFRFYNSDLFYPVLFAAAGYECTHNPEVIECFRAPHWRSTSHPLVHQFRELYPNPNRVAFH